MEANADKPSAGGRSTTSRRILGRAGDEHSLTAAAVSGWQTRLAGDLLWADHDDYDTARRVWNSMVDKHPAVIVRCRQTTDVVECVRFARQHDLLVSVRGGGHNYAGKSICDGGLVIDLSAMKDVRVDPVRRTAVAQAGLRLGEFDRATQKYGLATTLGINTDTGIAGLTLGGGYGWLAGRYGLACDNLLSVELVTTDGKLMQASARENSDLFWGIRGAGANLGVVTKFEYRVHPVDPVLGGTVLYPMSEGRSVLRLLDEFSTECPDEISTIGILLTAPDGQPAIGIAVCYCGRLDAGEAALAPLTRSMSVLTNDIAVQPYVQLQTMFDLAWPPGRMYYNKSGITRHLSDAAIEKLLEFGRTLPTQESAIGLQQLHGAAARVAVADTAFPHRFDHFCVFIQTATDDYAQLDNIVSWSRRCWEELHPEMERAVYVNALEDWLEEGEQRVREAYGTNYDRVAAVKAKYDPANFLTSNQNVRPAIPT